MEETEEMKKMLRNLVVKVHKSKKEGKSIFQRTVLVVSRKTGITRELRF